MIIGYARTSTTEQVAGFEAQLKELQTAGCEKIFKEQVSSVEVRTELQAAIEFIREGDVLVVCKIDRLARSISDLMAIIKTVEGKKSGIRILNLGMDTSSPTGKLMLTVLGGIAQFEREIMLERQREGIAKAKAEGKYRGRKQEVLRLLLAGTSKVDVAKQLEMGEASVYRILKRSIGNIFTNELNTDLNH